MKITLDLSLQSVRMYASKFAESKFKLVSGILCVWRCGRIILRYS